jgi:hypothetical protein
MEKSNNQYWNKFKIILMTAEEKYGKRDKSYTVLRIDFTDQEVPHIWYPDDCKNVVIRITENCKKDMNQAVFQIAHETIHCLCPTKKDTANILEEGLANLFSIEYCRENNHGSDWKATNQAYTDASNMVEALLEIDKDIIKKLRVIEPTISDITKEIILRVNSEISEGLANDLTKMFKKTI